MQVYLIAMGSLGDTLPFVHIGRAMADRGHDVALLANQYYQPLIESRGLRFRPVMTRERYENFVHNRRDGNQLASVVDMGKLMVEQTPPVYELLREEYVPGRTVVCAQAYAVGARIAQETLGVPLVTAHLQPLWMRSSYDIPQLPPWLSRAVGPLLNRVGDLVFDRSVGKEIMAFRSRLGLAAERRFMRYWWNSPELVFGLFPDWYVAPKPDWPPNVLQPGFPLPPLAEAEELPDDLSNFLDAGEPPLAFSQSSIASDARQFFATSLETVRRMRRRAVFLTPHADVLPDPLPEDVHYKPHASLDKLLPRCAAHVHHGGMGMIAHTLRAGIPHLTVPGIFDQPDNAARLAPLGVSANLVRKAYRPNRAVDRLNALLASSDVAAACRDYAERMRRTDCMAACCDALEAVASGRRDPSGDPKRVFSNRRVSRASAASAPSAAR